MAKLFKENGRLGPRKETAEKKAKTVMTCIHCGSKREIDTVIFGGAYRCAKCGKDMLTN